MEDCNSKERILELGKLLVSTFEDRGNVDTLRRWMCHYLAEKICEAETSNAEDKSAKMDECCSLILNIWAHRNEFDRDYRPMKSFEPIWKTIEDLAAGTSSTYDRFLDYQASLKSDTPTSQEWLNRARAIQAASTAMILDCLSRAAETTNEQDRAWVKAALETSAKEDKDLKAAAKLLDLKNFKDKSLIADLEITRKTTIEHLKRLKSK